MIDRAHNNGGGRAIARQAARTKRPLPEVEPPFPAGDRPGGGAPHGENAGCRHAQSRVRHGEIDPSNAPLSSAVFITQHIAQERMPARPVDAGHGTRAYDHRALRPLKRSDLIRRA